MAATELPAGYWLSHDASTAAPSVVPATASHHTPIQWWFCNDARDALRSVPQEPQGQVVYVDGVFDMFHAGHVAFLHKARAVGGDGATLLVGVITDQDAQWKRKPIMTHAERVAMLRSCRPGAQVIEHPPLVLTAEFLDRYGIDLVVHGDDDKQAEFFAVPLARGAMRYVQYTPGISTTDILERIAQRATARVRHPEGGGLTAGNAPPRTRTP
jgi:ethanolamine-phosphate cytidylyltransferase